MSDCELKIKNLSLAFSQQQHLLPAVQNLNLQIARGQCHGLVGESGSGKSLTALSIIQLLPNSCKISTASKIILHDVDLLQVSALEMQNIRRLKIGYIFQDAMAAFNPVLTIGKQISERLISSNNKAAQVWQLLQEVGIKDIKRAAKSFPHQLSGGQRQRAMIALALANKPTLLIADEPTTALDVSLQTQIIELLKQCQAKHNMAMLFISHDLAVVKQLAESVTVLRNGQVIEQQIANIFFSNPQHEYSKILMQASPDLKPEQKEIKTKCILEINNLDIKYKTGHWWQKNKLHHAVKNAGLQLMQAETLAIIGESASGKTSLAKAIMQLVAHSGEINFPDNAIKSRNMQMLFQDSSSALNPRLSIAKSLAEGCHIKAATEIHKKMLECVSRVGLDANCLNRFPHQFSGGQRQRLCIARALMCDSKILILDEPTSSLDVAHQKQIIELLIDLQNTHNMSYILITHHIGVVAQMAHRVVVMQHGTIIESGSCEEILENPQQAMTKSLIDAVPVL